MSLAEVAEVVTRLLSDKVPAVDEIHPEIVKTLDIVRLFWSSVLHGGPRQDLWSGRLRWRLRSNYRGIKLSGKV